MTRLPHEVWLVEDDAADTRLVERALNEQAAPLRLTHAPDGARALAYLGEARQRARARPDLILLDLDLPKRSGHEVLAEIRADEDTRDIPVIILSTSSSDEEVLRSYKLGANSYVVKPDLAGEYSTIARALREFWFDAALLPPAV